MAYTGRSAGNEVTVAIAVKDGRAVGYVCDGKKIEAWLEGTLTGRPARPEERRRRDTCHRRASTTEPSLGTVTVAGKEWPFAAEGVAVPAGLYEGRANVRRRRSPGSAGSSTKRARSPASRERARRRGGPRRALDPADPTAATIDGVPVTVTPLDGGDEVIRR